MVTNSDGDDVVFHDLRFPLASGVTQKEIAARLDKVKGFLPESPQFWNWLAARKAGGSKASGGTMLETQMAGATVLGSLELKGKALLATVNSAPRAEKVEMIVTEACGDLLMQPLTTIRTVEQLRSEQRRNRPQEAADEIPPEIARQLMRDHLDKLSRSAGRTDPRAWGEVASPGDAHGGGTGEGDRLAQAARKPQCRAWRWPDCRV